MIDIDGWMSGYLRAWSTDDPDEVTALFAEDARYLTAPYRDPIVGREAIVDWWVNEDEPSEPEFTWHPVAVTDDTAVVEGRTVYPGETTYRNIWVIEFSPQGAASSFTEWWMVEE